MSHSYMLTRREARSTVQVATSIPVEIYRQLIQIDPELSVSELVREAIRDHVTRQGERERERA